VGPATATNVEIPPKDTFRWHPKQPLSPSAEDDVTELNSMDLLPRAKWTERGEKEWLP
jgi:hypothetical protein